MKALAPLSLTALLFAGPAPAEGSAKDTPCGRTLAACDVAVSQALMTASAFAFALDEPMPAKVAATFVGLTVAGKRQASCLGQRARASLSGEQRAWLDQAGGAPTYDPAETGTDLLIVTPRTIIARQAYLERLDGRVLLSEGNPIIVRQVAADTSLPSIAQACGRVGESI